MDAKRVSLFYFCLKRWGFKISITNTNIKSTIVLFKFNLHKHVNTLFEEVERQHTLHIMCKYKIWLFVIIYRIHFKMVIVSKLRSFFRA